MLWIILTLTVAFIFAILNVIDKYILTDELKDPILCTTVYGFVTFFILGIITLITKQNLLIPLNIILISLFAGIFLSIGIFFYYKSLSHEEVSRVIPLLSLGPLFVLILATIFLNETFTLVKYLGIASLICGAFLISIRFGLKKKKMAVTPVIFAMILATLALALRSVLIRQATLYFPFMQIIFWFALGIFIIAAALLIKHHPKIRKKLQIKGIKHLILINIVSTLSLLLYIKAIEISPAVSLVAALLATQGFFVLIFASLLSKFKPSIICEPLTKKIIILKIIAIALLTTGVILII